MSSSEAQSILDSGQASFDYLNGRVLKVDLSGDRFDPWGYDRDNGQGSAQAAVDEVRAGKTVSSEAIQRVHAQGRSNAADELFGLDRDASRQREPSPTGRAGQIPAADRRAIPAEADDTAPQAHAVDIYTTVVIRDAAGMAERFEALGFDAHMTERLLPIMQEYAGRQLNALGINLGIQLCIYDYVQDLPPIMAALVNMSRDDLVSVMTGDPDMQRAVRDVMQDVTQRARERSAGPAGNAQPTVGGAGRPLTAGSNLTDRPAGARTNPQQGRHSL